MPAAVVPEPPWWTTARQDGKGGRVIQRADYLDVVETWEVSVVIGTAAAANQRPLAQFRAGRADHGDRVSGCCNRRAAKAEEDRRRSVRNPRQHLVVGIRRQLQRQRADEGSSAIRFHPFRRRPGQAELVVGLDLR